MNIGKVVKVNTTAEPDVIPVRNWPQPKPQPRPLPVPDWPTRKTEPAQAPEKVDANGSLQAPCHHQE